MFERIQELFRAFYVSLSEVQQQRMISTLVIVLLLLIVRLVAMRVLHRRFQSNTRALYNGRKTVEYLLVIVGAILIGRMWLTGVESLVTYFGLLTAGLAIALQDLIVNLAGWLFIIWRRPFLVGDRIEVSDAMGDVIDIRLFQFTMMEIGGGRVKADQSTGRLIHVPNGRVFKDTVINTHQGMPLIWNEIPVVVTFESDWRRAKSLLTEVVNRLAPDVSDVARRYARRAEKRFVIDYGNVSPTVYTSVVDHGVELTLRYMVDPRRRRGSEQVMWEAILAAFEKHWDIDFAYPTQREYIHFQERQAQQELDPQDAPTQVARPIEWSQKRSKRDDE